MTSHPVSARREGLSEARNPPRTAVCTIVSANYLARARVLMESLAVHHPDWERHVLLVDEVAGRIRPADEAFCLTEVSALPFSDPRPLFFRYSLLELNTAVKAPYLQWLFLERDFDRVVYVDPDCVVYGPLTVAEDLLDDGALMCLTPHLSGPLSDDRRPTEHDVLQAGNFNLGFIALARHSDLSRFLAWWWEKLEHRCLVDLEAGLFVDQKWMDLAPGLFPDVAIIRDPGYNVAYWNLPHRHVARDAGAYRVDDRPLTFFHFSGFDPRSPERFSIHQDRFTLDQVGDVRTLVDDYGRSLIAAREDECSKHEYAFGRLEDGTRIPSALRSLYRSSDSVQRAGGDDPFALPSSYFNESVAELPTGPLISQLLHHIWSERADLQRAFPDPLGSHRGELARWFVDCLAPELDLPHVFVAPVLRSIASSDPDRRAGRTWRTRVRRLALTAKPLAKRLLSEPVRNRLKEWVPGPGVPVRTRRPSIGTVGLPGAHTSPQPRHQSRRLSATGPGDR